MFELFICAFFYTLGYAVGRIDLIKAVVTGSTHDRQIGFLGNDGSRRQVKKIDIDDTKYVTAVETDTYEKGFTEIGDKTVSQDDISTSVSRLAQLKKK